MISQDFLVELGSEELPPKALKKLGESFLHGVEKGLNQAKLTYSRAYFYASPRRLAVVIEQLVTQQPDQTISIDGPPITIAFDSEGIPTPAALGFAKKCGVSIEKIDISGIKLRFNQEIKGSPTTLLLPNIVEQTLTDLPIPKRMRWGKSRTEFVRPSQWLVMLFGNEVVNCSILGQTAGRVSKGHRFHHPQDINITSPAQYAENLLTAYVIADFNLRRKKIAQGIETLAAEQNGTAIVPASLLDEVTALVEWPVPLVCSFEERFLAVPQEALITTMQENQKYFCLTDENNKLLPRFITIVNIESKNPKQIIQGNEKVVRPRLTDAEFFFNQDKKQPLENLNQTLTNVVFQAKLGSVYDKACRVSSLAGFIASKLNANATDAKRAGILSKCDLASEMVSEFPELQGTAGYYYAQSSGESYDVALALREQYMPVGAGAPLPSAPISSVLAISDKLDTLVGIFGINMPPTGSKDPYALRRSALGIIRILIEKQLDLDLVEAIEYSIKLYGESIESKSLSEQVQNFIFDRLRARYEDQKVDILVYQSVRALNPSSPLDFDLRVQAVQRFQSRPEAASLASINKRVSNLLDKSNYTGVTDIVPHYFDNPAEFTLNSAVQQAEQQVYPLIESQKYNEALMYLAKLNTPVNQFFEKVLINAEDPCVKTNRYALLAKLRHLFLGVADISLLS
ncbi:UNVERIFIED_CONTAM: hypothetical protein GTU68_008211 [Idotea baltica]|nr:hypothetical protein [Idotea baltica]